MLAIVAHTQDVPLTYTPNEAKWTLHLLRIFLYPQILFASWEAPATFPARKGLHVVSKSRQLRPRGRYLQVAYVPPPFRRSESNLAKSSGNAFRKCENSGESWRTAPMASGAKLSRRAVRIMAAPSGSNNLVFQSAIRTSCAVDPICKTKAGVRLRTTKLVTLRHSSTSMA